MEQENFQKLIEVISSAIESLPNPPRESIKKEFEKMKEQIIENRPPRIMIMMTNKEQHSVSIMVNLFIR